MPPPEAAGARFNVQKPFKAGGDVFALNGLGYIHRYSTVLMKSELSLNLKADAF